MNNFFQFTVALALIILLFAVSDPFMYWMPPAASMLALLAAAGLVVVFAGFVLRENGGDERDETHRSFAGRAGYLAGLAVLSVALVQQGFAHTLDLWIPLAIGVMVIAKIAARIFADRYR